MGEHSEYARRCQAIDLLRRGTRFAAAAQAVGRSRSWLAKWWRRYRRGGLSARAGGNPRAGYEALSIFRQRSHPRVRRGVKLVHDVMAVQAQARLVHDVMAATAGQSSQPEGLTPH